MIKPGEGNQSADLFNHQSASLVPGIGTLKGYDNLITDFVAVVCFIL